MNFADVAKIPIPLPPLSEQKEIVEYIERKTAKIDELAQKLEDEVKKLKEFRERLVADVVTGQRKVV
jgi:type I restriction enzyme S subunit